MLRRLAVVAVAAAVAVPTIAAQGLREAENSQRRIQIGIGGGAIIPRTQARYQDVLAGAAGQAYLLLRIAPGLPALRIGADFAQMKFGKARSGVSEVDLGDTRRQLGGIASLRFDLLPGPIKPYILGGVGAFNIQETIQNISDSTFTTTKIGFDGGGGISFRMGRIAGFIETRIQNVYTKDQGFINTKSISAFPVTFGLIF